MDNPNDSSRFNGRIHNTGGKKEEGTPPPESGVPPEESGGPSRRGLARALGVDSKQSLRRRRGVEPCGGAMHSIFRCRPDARRPAHSHGRGRSDDPTVGQAPDPDHSAGGPFTDANSMHQGA